MLGVDVGKLLTGAVETLFEAGPDDRVFDAFILVAPLVLLAIAVLGRTTATTVLAGGYVLGFVGYVLALGVRHVRSESD
ncbi:hypothetical protein [Halospeciosus flavus]|uniref:Uncharacterized protein n=1 Tax=Halospeciosus flavus TaxID=3032283 RepID=A0ABD5Z1B0_9EURY|nr:hypothetical protein [Halospeciosus flavus]